MQQNIKEFSYHKITDISALNHLKTEWRKTLTAPQDDMWETFAEYAHHWVLSDGNQTIGYACVNEDNILLQFFILPDWMQNSIVIFQQFIDEQNINKAIIGTNNPVCISVAMHFQQVVKIDTYLFTDFLNVDNAEKEGTFRCAESDELEQLVDFCHENMGGAKEWLSGYLANLLKRKEFFVFENEGEILGTCEVRKSDTDATIANLGMVVSSSHRKKGLGTFLLGKAKEIAIQWNRQPVCSCERDNIASLKSIQNNGFRSINQMLLMEF